MYVGDCNMIQAMKRIIIKVIDWFLFSMLTEKQREYFKNKLTENQKNLIKDVLRIGKKQHYKEKIKTITYKLYSLGFTQVALNELNKLINHEKEDRYIKELARWEIILWHANKYDEQHAKIALEHINILQSEKIDPT